MGCIGKVEEKEGKRNPIPISSQSSVRDFGYDYGYVKSVDSMDKVNSVRSTGPIVNSMDSVDNSAVIRRRGGAAGMKGAMLSTLSVDDWSRAALAVDIVHAVHTLDIAIAIVIVIAKVTNTG